MLEDWDRQKGAIRPKKPLSEIEENPSNKHTPSKKSKGGKAKEEPIVEAQPELPVIEESREGIGIPLLTIPGYQEMEAITMQLFNSGLPSVESILEGLGLCTDVVPLPGPVEFQVYPFPLKRRNIDHASHERFSFIAASPNDPYVMCIHSVVMYL